MRSEYGAGFATSMLVFAVGAILYWGITTTQTHGFRLSTIGVILMIVGAVGFAITPCPFGRLRGSSPQYLRPADDR
jgi:hypothetical protein